MWAKNNPSPLSSTPCGTPTKETYPPLRVQLIACSIASCVPTHSSTESAPIPLVMSIIRATPSSPRSATTSVAPNSRASFCREAFRLMTMIRSAPICLAESTPYLPFRTPELAELQMLFEHTERQFDIPPARIQAGQLSQRELSWIQHI